jgi:hypothetical protein
LLLDLLFDKQIDIYDIIIILFNLLFLDFLRLNKDVKFAIIFIQIKEFSKVNKEYLNSKEFILLLHFLILNSLSKSLNKIRFIL